MHAGAQHDTLCTWRDFLADAPEPTPTSTSIATGVSPGKGIWTQALAGGWVDGTTRRYASLTAAKCDMSRT